MVCLDSDILINFLRNDPQTVKFISQLKEKKETICISSINTFELLKGIPLASKMDRENVTRFLSNFKILDFNFETSKKAAEIFSELKSKGEIIDMADIMIGSIAMSNNQILITGNVKHFERITGIKIEKS